MSELKQHLERMRQIFRGIDTYGAGSRVEQASKFRIEVMYDDIIEAALKNPSDPVPPVDILVSLSGFSPETTLLAFEFVRPRELVVISSKNLKGKYDMIVDKLRGRLEPSNIQLKLCDPADPLGIYRIISQVVRPQPDGRTSSAIIDITGGKKVMSASAALAASQLDLPMCYVNSDFDEELRVGVPGTERLKVVANPTKLFRYNEFEAAKATFRSGVYAEARDRFAELSETMSEPLQARFLRDLAGLYQAWCDLDVAQLGKLAVSVKDKLDDPRLELAAESRERLTKQLAFVDLLANKDGSALLLYFFLLGEHYQRLGRLDFAALLFYRTIEQSLSERLSLAYGGFNLEKPDYSLFGVDQQELKQRYLDVAGQVFRNSDHDTLPRPVGLLDAVLLLHVVQDELLSRAKIEDIGGVQHVRNLVTGRNRSVLAHGVDSVEQHQCHQLRGRALQNLRAFWGLHHSHERVADWINALRFLAEV